MRTVARDGVGGIFGRSSSVGAPVVGAVTRYNGNQRALPVAGFGADWAPGQPTPDARTLAAHGYYRGVDMGGQGTCSFEQMPPEWDCNPPNVSLVALYARASNLAMDQFVAAIRAGKLSSPPSFPPLASPTTRSLSAGSSNTGLFIGLGFAVLVLGSVVIMKKA
jgi:hypothetical protein